MNKKTRQANGGRGKKKAASGGPPGRGKGKAKTQQTTAGGNKTPTGGQKGNPRGGTGGQRQRAQRLKQKAKKTLQKTPSRQQATPSKPVTGVKLRLGILGKVGKGRGLKKTPGSASGNGNRPGSRLKALRYVKVMFQWGGMGVHLYVPTTDVHYHNVCCPEP